jgi:hypothetical protein
VTGLAYRESGASATAFPGGCLIQLTVNTESRCIFEQSIGCHTISIAPEPARGRLYWCGLCECRAHPDTYVQCEYDGNRIGEDIRRGVVMAASDRSTNAVRVSQIRNLMIGILLDAY